MQTTWVLSDEELRVLVSMFDEGDVFGLVLKDSEPDREQVLESIKTKGLLEDHDGKTRLKDGLELVLLTMLDKQVGITMQIEGTSENRCNLYMHGETIVFLRKEEDGDYGLSWLPFIPMALGGMYDFYDRYLVQGSENTVMQYTMVSDFDEPLFRRLQKVGETIWCTGSGIDNELMESAPAEAFSELQKLVVFAHAWCMKTARE